MDKNKKLEILLDNLKLKFDLVNSSYDAVDNKANYLIGFETALVIAFYSIPNRINNGIKNFELITATIFLLVSMILLIITVWPKKFQTPIVEMQKAKKYLKLDEKSFLKQIIVDLDGSIDKNKNILFKKTIHYKYAIVFLIIAIILFILSKSGRFYV